MTTHRYSGAAMILLAAGALGLFGLVPSSASALGLGHRPTWVSRGGMVDESLALSPDGTTAYVAGATRAMTVVALDARTGARKWAARTPGGYASGVTVSPDGSRVYVTGSQNVNALRSVIVSAAFDAVDGSVLWSQRFTPGPGQSAGSADMGLAADGDRVYVTSPFEGISGGSNDHWDFGAIAYDADTGDQLWSSRYDGAGDSNDVPYSDARLNPDGSLVYVTGVTDPTGCGDYATVAFSTADGSQAWVAVGGGAGCDLGQAVARPRMARRST